MYTSVSVAMVLSNAIEVFQFSEGCRVLIDLWINLTEENFMYS